MPAPRSGKGRRPAPTPIVPRGGRWLGCEDRVAWLLRANRLYGHNRELAAGRTFARAFGGGRADRALDAAQIARWELVATRADYRTVRRYEELLGLADNRLTVLADTVYREARGTPGRSTLDRGLDPHSARVRGRTAELIDLALGSGAMTGPDWDELTTNLWSLPSVFLHPQRAWADLAQRLLAEMIIADGTDWLWRSEALSRLLGHPDADTSVMAACESLIADRTNQVFIEPMTVLEVSPHPLAARSLVRQIVNPTNEHAFRGAWWSVAEKVGRDHFSPADLATISGHAASVLVSDGQHPGCRLAAAEFLRQVHEPKPAIRTVLRGVAASDQIIQQVLATGRAADGQGSRAMVDKLCASALSRMPYDVLDRDPMLTRLVDEMLFHPQISRRVIAARLIEATPYRTAVGAVLTAELRRPAVLADAPLASAMVHATAHLSERDGRQLLERLVLTSGKPSPVTEAAAWALGHACGESADQFWSRAFDRLFRQAGSAPSSTMESTGPNTASPIAASVLRGLVYALGVSRQEAMLRQLRAEPGIPACTRVAAAWWLNTPRHILLSTRRERPVAQPDGS